MKATDARRRALSQTFFEAADLGTALDRIGFVQADPIRAPARAQDLILRQRVPGYRAGLLEARYPELPVFEDMLHVYGFVARKHYALLHPRAAAARRDWPVENEHPHLRRALLAHIRRHGPAHPRDVVARFGRAAVMNAWGGSSAATTRMLDHLHTEGHLCVVRREGGIRVYGLAPPVAVRAKPTERAQGLVRLLVGLYGPLPRASLNGLLYMLGTRGGPRDRLERALSQLLRRGEVESAPVDSLEYLFPGSADAPEAPEAPERVRFLAPFDPLVWDRRRFEHLWGWRYRFEAYTPAPRRQFGYYALPLLWRDQVIGWANVSAVAGPGGVRAEAKLGFVARRPREPAFKEALECELASMTHFLRAAVDADASILPVRQ